MWELYSRLQSWGPGPGLAPPSIFVAAALFSESNKNGQMEWPAQRRWALENTLIELNWSRKGNRQRYLHLYHFSGKWWWDYEPRSWEYNGKTLSDVTRWEDKINRCIQTHLSICLESKPWIQTQFLSFWDSSVCLSMCCQKLTTQNLTKIHQRFTYPCPIHPSLHWTERSI